jgi:CreA protein
MIATTTWRTTAVALMTLSLTTACAALRAETIGSVDTTFRMVGSNDSIEIEAFDDPKIGGVTCHLSRAVTGGVGKLIGTSVDTSDASIACRQIGPIRITEPLVDGEKVFSERRSVVFKTLQVVRFCDRKRNTLVYLVYSTKVIEGSPKNSISTVPMMPWQTGGGERVVAECGGKHE